MSISRRYFIGGVGSLSFMGSANQLFADEKPLLRIGVMTDTHIGPRKVSCGRVKLACQLFRKHGVDMMVNVGDLADLHYPTGYTAYRETIDEVYEGIAAENRPKEVFVYAAHDLFKYKGNPNRRLWTGDSGR